MILAALAVTAGVALILVGLLLAPAVAFVAAGAGLCWWGLMVVDVGGER